jgi:hypothetical protein
LLNELIESPDRDAQALIGKMTVDPVFESVRDWLKNRARVKELQNAEPPPLTVEGVRHIERRFERLPVDRDSIFCLMINRLSDPQHDELPSPCMGFDVAKRGKTPKGHSPSK